ncbi:hypothetical protein DFH28DRAFT_186406 [Melampsora americana]|nr:hypothetical protein DFH28DRAFT_186406 [Melampsora americana]
MCFHLQFLHLFTSKHSIRLITTTIIINQSYSNLYYSTSWIKSISISINLPSDLPASLRTYSGSGLIYYKLNASS